MVLLEFPTRRTRAKLERKYTYIPFRYFKIVAARARYSRRSIILRKSIVLIYTRKVSYIGACGSLGKLNAHSLADSQFLI